MLLVVVLHVSKKKMDRGVSEWGVDNPSFSRIFFYFFKFDKTPYINYCRIIKKKLLITIMSPWHLGILLVMLFKQDI